MYHLAEFIYDNYQYSSPAPIDAIILTGDIATTGTRNDLELALRFVEGPESAVDPLMHGPHIPTLAAAADATAHAPGSGKIPLWLLPGNHDRIWKIHPPPGFPNALYVPCSKLFDRIFANHWGRKVKEFPTVIRSGLHVKLIAADFSLKRPWHYSGLWPFNMYAQGKVYTDILKELVQITENVKRNLPQPLAILWAVHFPPGFPGISEAMKLNEEVDLLDAADDCGVHGILAGHTHEPLRYGFDDRKIEVFCAGTTTQDHAPRGHYFHIMEISDNSHGRISITRENYNFDIITRRFIRV